MACLQQLTQGLGRNQEAAPGESVNRLANWICKMLTDWACPCAKMAFQGQGTGYEALHGDSLSGQ